MGESTIFHLEDEHGVEHAYEVIGTFYLDDDMYMALFRIGNPDESEVDLIGFHAGPNDEIIFDPIDDPALYQRVGEQFLELFGPEDDPIPANKETANEEDFCYQAEDGRLFILGEHGEPIFLDENGQPIKH